MLLRPTIATTEIQEMSVCLVFLPEVENTRQTAEMGTQILTISDCRRTAAGKLSDSEDQALNVFMSTNFDTGRLITLPNRGFQISLMM